MIIIRGCLQNFHDLGFDWERSEGRAGLSCEPGEAFRTNKRSEIGSLVIYLAGGIF